MQEINLTELLPTLRQLNRTDKLRLVQYLVSEIAREEGTSFEVGDIHPVWSPYDSFEAASVLLTALEEEKRAGS